VETSYGVTDSCYVKASDTNEYLAVGLEDGTVHLFDLTRNAGKSYQKPVFKTKKAKKDAEDLDETTYKQFAETSYEHSDSVVSVEASADQNLFISASKDGFVILWQVKSAEEANGDDLLHYVTEQDVGEPVTKAKWLTSESILVSTSAGSLFISKLAKDS